MSALDVVTVVGLVVALHTPALVTALVVLLYRPGGPSALLEGLAARLEDGWQRLASSIGALSLGAERAPLQPEPEPLTPPRGRRTIRHCWRCGGMRALTGTGVFIDHEHRSGWHCKGSGRQPEERE